MSGHEVSLFRKCVLIGSGIVFTAAFFGWINHRLPSNKRQLQRADTEIDRADRNAPTSLDTARLLKRSS